MKPCRPHAGLITFYGGLTLNIYLGNFCKNVELGTERGFGSKIFMNVKIPTVIYYAYAYSRYTRILLINYDHKKETLQASTTVCHPIDLDN